MNILIYTVFFFVFFLIELLYFKLADRYNIIDKPNFRSSHQQITIRGGGIIFTIGVLLFFVAFNFLYPYFTLGLLLISVISFADDLKPISNRIRIVCHFAAVLLMFYQIGVLQLPGYILIICFIMAIGTINAINFMDGINGLTGIYSLITLLSLWYINSYIGIDFISNDLLIVSIISVIVFNVFNFRVRAKCFAGDVGSVGIAFILIFLIGSLILKSENLSYVLLLLLYGLDAVSTIFFRLIRKENIFAAHRSLFYQFLANDKRIPHPVVAFGYAIIQLIFNALLIIVNPSYIWAIIGAIAIGLLFIALRFTLEGKSRLLIGQKSSIRA